MQNSTLRSTIVTSILTATFSMGSAVSAEPAKPGDYKIDPAHTSIQFTVSHLAISELVGRFNTFEGNLKLSQDGNASVEVIIETSSIDTSHKKRDDHLRSPDFFNAKQFPEMKFTSTKVSFNNDGEPTGIEGTLSLHGKTNPVILIVEPVGAGADPWGGYRAGYRANTSIKRSDYGMKFMLGGVGDDIDIVFNIEAIKQ